MSSSATQWKILWRPADARAPLGAVRSTAQIAGSTGGAMAVTVILALVSGIYDGVRARLNDLQSLAGSFLPPTRRSHVASLLHAIGLRPETKESPDRHSTPRSSRIRSLLAAWSLLVLLGVALHPIQALADALRPVTLVSWSSAAWTPATSGILDLASSDRLIFRTSGGAENAIAYTEIQGFAYASKVTHHLGVLPAIAVGLFAARRHRHLITIDFLDEAHTRQIAVFELSRDDASTLLSTLRARTTVCPAKALAGCGGTVD